MRKEKAEEAEVGELKTKVDLTCILFQRIWPGDAVATRSSNS